MHSLVQGSVNSSALMLLGLALCSAEISAQAAPWPAARARHHMVHDPSTGRLLLFGAARDSVLWAWDGAGWRQEPGGVPSRANEAAGYDIDRNRLVLHGGSARVRGELDDTGEWDHRTWRSVSSSGTGPRAHHAMIYDPVRMQMVLFGNSDNAEANDTWGWDGQQWRQLADDGPPRRGVFALAFDSRRGVVVLFGGYGSRNTILADTWEWNGVAWRQVVTDSAPSPRYDTRMVFDAVRNRVILFGGQGQDANLGDTWAYDGAAWTRLPVRGPAPRNGHAMAFDPRSGTVLLFGGRDEPTYLNDFWSFDGTWRQIASR